MIEKNAVIVERDLPYLGPERGERLDLYRPAPGRFAGLLPGIVVIHGGGWYAQNKDDPRERSIASTLAFNGYVCVSIDYRLVDVDGPPGQPALWPSNLHDCRQGVAYLRRRAEDLGIDPDHIGAIGGSAGGHLAAMLGCSADEPGPHPPGPVDAPGPAEAALFRVQAVVCLYGIGDLAGWISRASVHRRGMDALLRMMGGTPEEVPGVYRSASPVSFASKRTAPILLIHGTEDEIVPCGESERYASALAEAGAEHELVIVPGAVHSFDLEPPQRDLRPPVLSFFTKHLNSMRN